MILADSSAWVEFDRATGSPVDLRLTELIGVGGQLAVTEPVLMEVLAGARTEERATDLRRLLQSVALEPLDVLIDYESAADIYRRCRRAGVTPRGLIDCLIAAVALRTQAALLCRDADLRRVACVVGITLDPAST